MFEDVKVDHPKNPSPISSLARIGNFPQQRQAEEVMGIVWGTKCSLGCFGCAFEGGQPDKPCDRNVIIG